MTSSIRLSIHRAAKLVAPIRRGRRLAVWIALALQLCSVPLAAVSHQHEHNRHSCCSPAGYATPAHPHATAVGDERHHADGRRTHRCRLGRCRDAGRQAAVPTACGGHACLTTAGHQGHRGADADGAVTTVAATPAEGTGAASTSCAACEFLAKHVAVVPWTWFDGSFLARWDEPRVHPTRPAAARVAAFLARGPPA
jgi:hypothetical protein